MDDHPPEPLTGGEPTTRKAAFDLEAFLDCVVAVVGIATGLVLALLWTLVTGYLSFRSIQTVMSAPEWAERVRYEEAQMIETADEVAAFHRREGRWPSSGELHCDLDPRCVAPTAFLVFDSVAVEDGRAVLASSIVSAMFQPNPMPRVTLHLDIETRALRESSLRHASGWVLREGPRALLASALALAPWACLAAWATRRRRGRTPPPADSSAFGT